MKRLSLILGSFLIFSTTEAFGDFSGVWIGQGKARDTLGQSFPCDEIFWEFRRSATKFTIVSGSVECGDGPGLYFGMHVFDVKGNELYMEGKKQGTISPTEIIIGPDADDDSLSIVYFELVGTKIDYSDNFAMGLGPFFSIWTVGSLTRKSELFSSPDDYPASKLREGARRRKKLEVPPHAQKGKLK